MNTTTNEQLLQSLATQLSKARDEVGKKQETAAKELGISRSTLSKYENGDLRGLTIDCLLEMSRLYNRSLLSFFPNEQAIHFIFSPTDGAQYNNNQQAYTLHSQADGYREMIAHLKAEIDFLRQKLA
jgi:transcriptional regulator with XRE-family HTH domain